jgi:hypothetical protein
MPNMIIDALILLANNELQPDDSREGLCKQLFLHGGLVVLREFKEAVVEWPEYSGTPNFPVPGGAIAYMETEDLWDPATEYGQARRRLCAWYAKYLQDNA